MATDAVRKDARGTLAGLGSGLAVGLLCGTDLGSRVTVASLITWARRRGRIASDEATRDGTLELPAALWDGNRTRTLAVAGRGGCEGLAVAAAAAIRTYVIGADFAAGTISVASTITATLVSCSLVGASIVGIYARRHRGALAVVLPR